jgi:tetratricopeptide (TPR) repeat protein
MDFQFAPVKGSVTFLQRTAAPAPAQPQAPAASIDAAFSLGEALESTDREAAEAAYRKVLALDPEHADAYLNLGALLCEAKRYKEAVVLYDEALRRKPGEALLHFNRAVALEDQGRPMEALAAYNTSLQLAPDLADAHYNAARLHEQLGDAKNAVRHFSAYRRLERRR